MKIVYKKPALFYSLPKEKVLHVENMIKKTGSLFKNSCVSEAICQGIAEKKWNC